MTDPSARVPLEPVDEIEPHERHRRELLAALIVERFTPYRPPSAADRSRKGAA